VTPAFPAHLRRHKRGTVLRPTGRPGDFDADHVDCPSVIRAAGRYLMAYTGWDGRTLRIGLAESDDLLAWRNRRLILDAGAPGSWDVGGVSGPCLLRRRGQYLVLYCGFPDGGYEAGPGAIGAAVSNDLDTWTRLPGNPLLTAGDPDAGSWEAAGLYRPFLLSQPGALYLFYNAKDAASGDWHEQIGMATSRDLVKWTRLPHNPVVRHGPRGAWDARFCADPCVVRIGGVWHMFYYGFDGQHAQEGLATSHDLLEWQKSPFNPIITHGAAGAYDSQHAHKPWVLRRGGRWYHFYCAVGSEGRTIALATSKPLTPR